MILNFYSCFYNSTYFSTYVLVWTMYFCNICFSGYYILVWKLHFFNSYNSKFNFIFRIWFVNFQACGIVIWKLESCGELSMSSNSDQGGITCGAIDEPWKSSKTIDEHVNINFRDKNVIIARFRDKNEVFCYIYWYIYD